MRNPGKPRIIEVNRKQHILRPTDIEQLVDEEHPVRAIWEFVGRMDLSKFYNLISSVEGTAGRSAWDPKLLVSIWIYAYSKGIGSAREIERCFDYEPGFQWLTGMEVINHHTLSDFRMSGKAMLDKLFREALGILCADGLITLERVMHDGTKIQASAGRDTLRRENRIREFLKLAKKQVKAMGDPRKEDVSKRRRKARERACRERKERLELALEELEKLRETRKDKESKEQTRASVTDPQARNMKQSDGGFAPSYNAQISTDSACGIVVGVSVTQSGTDCNELIPALDEISKNCGTSPDQVVVDGGFTNVENIIDVTSKQIDFIGSTGEKRGPTLEGRMKRQGIQEDFFPDKFIFNSDINQYTCPAGKVLPEKKLQKNSGSVTHIYEADAKDCMNCPFKQLCCPQSKEGRAVSRKVDNSVMATFKAKMETKEAKQIYKQRGPVAEFTNAWIKSKIGLRQFSVRGLEKVNQELRWACIALNVSYWRRLTQLA